MSASPRRSLLWAGALVLATAFFYLPALTNGYVWDDDAYVTRNATLRSVDGLRRIWLEPRSIPQYYPLVHTTYWLEYRLWGLEPAGYHLVNVLLHALNAVVLWRVLLRLAVPGALLAAAAFALHPVHVESVAWITERKNTLSGLFYLASFAAYLRFAGVAGRGAPRAPEGETNARPRWSAYAASFALFVGALLSKTVTASLPAALLLVVWWKRPRDLRRHALLLAPFLALGAALGLYTAWLEKVHVGATGAEWGLGLVERVLVAGRVLWFYAAKLLWPQPLMFVYPRWDVDASAWWQYLFPATFAAVVCAGWLLRERIGKGPLVAVLFFAGTLFPASGFLDVFPMQFSFVADHFQYLASIGILALASAALVTALERAGLLGSAPRDAQPARVPAAGAILCGTLLVVLGTLTWSQSQVYRDSETLWRDTIAKNPSAWVAYINLGKHLALTGRTEEAVASYQEALRLRPDTERAHYDLSYLMLTTGRVDEAAAHLREVVRLEPTNVSALDHLGSVLASQGRTDEAKAQFRKALALEPGFASARLNLAGALLSEGQLDEAIAEYRTVLARHPRNALVHQRLAVALETAGRRGEAIAHYRRALGLRPALAEAREALARLGAGGAPPGAAPLPPRDAP